MGAVLPDWCGRRCDCPGTPGRLAGLRRPTQSVVWPFTVKKSGSIGWVGPLCRAFAGLDAGKVVLSQPHSMIRLTAYPRGAYLHLIPPLVSLAFSPVKYLGEMHTQLPCLRQRW